MGIEILGLSIFDMLGYLLPGYIVLFTTSLLESTFSKGKLFNLLNIGENLFLFSLLAYFLGILCHSLFSMYVNGYRYLKSKWEISALDIQKNNLNGRKSPRYIPINKDRNNRCINDETMKKIEESLISSYSLSPTSNLTNLQKYMMADSYIIAKGESIERDSLILREGFFKTSTFAFILLTITIICSLLKGGLTLQIDEERQVILNLYQTGLLSVGICSATAILNHRRRFFHRLKIDNTLLLFLAMFIQNVENTKGNLKKNVSTKRRTNVVIH